MPAFHDVRFPVDVALGARGGPERKTEIVTLGSGAERRNARWAHARRRWNAGIGIRTRARLAEVVAFFEERRGRLHGFRWKDALDNTSALPGAAVTPLDQLLGEGDGVTAAFRLVKRYGTGDDPYVRPIAKPVAGMVRIAVAGVEAEEGTHFTLDAATGVVTFLPGHVPADGLAVTAGFAFDVPVRFDTDALEIDLSAFDAGAIPDVPVIEIRL